MKRIVAGAIILTAICSIVAISCMDRQPKPVCPVPTEISSSENERGGFNGIDLLVVVDNSGSMNEEQAILATGFFTLINSLAAPTVDWPYEAVGNMRVAITTSDMGLQYGDGLTKGVPTNIGNCDATGDDGTFQSIDVSVVDIESGAIACDKGGSQCPQDFTCQDTGGGVFRCVAPSNPYTINCDDPIGGDWAETTAEAFNANLATQVSCLSAQGTTGCGIEQQLQAAPRALAQQGKEFLVYDHLLAVLIVSDEEDCSIEDPALFDTPEWVSGGVYDVNDPSKGHLNTACNLPASNETDYLYPPEHFFDALIAAKGGNVNAVIFAAIAGVPPGPECEGNGTEIKGCLDTKDMQLAEQVFTYPNGTSQFYHFAPACERVGFTTARPGRRYVELAEKFGSNSYIYSICNADWSPAMASIAAVIAQAIGAQCYTKSLEWQLVPEAEAPAGCTNCGSAKCDMIAIFERTDEAATCPDGLTFVSEEELDSNVFRTVCRVPSFATPKFCDQTGPYVEQSDVGWYYCENLNYENFEEACNDNIDNDENGAVDCADATCADCLICGGGGGGTCVDTCTYSVEMTERAKELTQGASVAIQCLQQFTIVDENCQENTRASCNDGADNDGNGLWDCEAGADHFADPNCCPLTVNSDNTCSPKDAFADNCAGVPVLDGDPTVDTVCEANARLLNCTLQE